MGHPMSIHGRYSSKPLDPDVARDLVIRIEHQGVNTDRIVVETPAQRPDPTTARIDGPALRRPIARVGLGITIGGLVGLAVGLIVVAVSSATTVTVAIAGIVGAVAGLLMALYWRLPINRSIARVDAADLAIVTVDLSELDEGTAERVIARVDLA